MRRAPLFALGVAAVAAAGCGGKGSSPDRVNFRLPSSVAFFVGRTVQNASALLPYFAVANEGRNDLTLVDATNDVVLNAPVMLRPLAISFPGRPALVASASLGDGGADLLVGVAAGDSKLQLVQTWNPANPVDADAVSGQAVDLGADVLQIVALPRGGAAAGAARLAVSLAGNRLAVVQYLRRPADGAVVKDTVTVHGLGFEAADIGVLPANPGLAYPGDPAHVYAATLDPIGAGAVLGVAEIDVSVDVEPWTVRGLDARGPTRLVAAARLRERRNDLPVAGDPGAIDPGPGAFTGQPDVTRVYAILDEGSCGVQHRIDCGIVTLDPDKTPAAGDDHIPEDWAGWMPYRAPISVRGRANALVVSMPPLYAPADDTYGAAFMHLALGSGTAVNPVVATTAVGMIAGAAGTLEFFDLGRFEPASTTNVPVTAAGLATIPRELNRLSLEDPVSGAFVTSDTASEAIHVTPGYAQDEVWTVTYEGALPELQNRSAEAALISAGQPWLAVQLGDGKPGDANRTLSQVARLFHPALGVRVGDIVVIRADSLSRAGVTGCVGLPAPGIAADLAETAPKEFETEVTQLLPPTIDYPGGAVGLKVRARPPIEITSATDPATPPEWQACWDAFASALATSPLENLVVSFQAGGDDHLLLTGSQLGYLGRPVLNVLYTLRYKADPAETGLPAWAYQDEEALAASCPLADWDGRFPLADPVATCGGGGCDRDLCEQLVLARKVRRRYHLAEDCSSDDTCLTRYPTATFPLVNGPAVSFRVGHQIVAGATTSTRIRGLLTLSFSTSSGLTSLTANVGGPLSNPNGALAFDRTPYLDDKSVGYRFIVTYPGNQVADVTPSVNPVSFSVMR